MSKIFLISIVTLLFVMNVNGFLGEKYPYLPTVDYVEISKYLGEWNELYRLPTRGEDDVIKGFSTCFNVTAHYTLNAD
jgi:lipocalin